MTVVADLHVHTTNSDGALELGAVPDAARRAGLDAVAITDHDRFHPGLEAPVVDRDGVTVIAGIELRAELCGGRAGTAPDGAEGMRVDLLGYGLRPTTALREEVDRLQRDRQRRAEAMIERVEERTGATLDLTPQAGIGRPHVARAIERSDAPYDYESAFEHLIGDGRPCFVSRRLPSYERARNLLAESCALVGLAHPYRYERPEAALSLTAALDAVERWYPYDRDVDQGPVDRAIREHDLVPTGGSDAHDDVLARAGLDAGAYERVRSRLPRP